MSKHAERIEISDDDESFDLVNDLEEGIMDELEISSDEDPELPKVNVQSIKDAIVKKLFSSKFESNKGTSNFKYSKRSIEPQGTKHMISGVPVMLPVQPYPCQKALMSTMINAMKNNKNCLLESPTGSGKTLALLCAALAWQKYETEQLTKAMENCPLHDPEMTGSPQAKNSAVTPLKENYKNSSPQKMFTRTNFGEKSIYGKPTIVDGFDALAVTKRPLEDLPDKAESGLVKLHKKRRLFEEEPHVNKTVGNSPPNTPQKNNNVSPPVTPQKSMPTIYYGARTHKQLKQVIKEFARTTYCGDVPMCLLASRDYTCLREFDRNLYKSKNDMCRVCIKKKSASAEHPEGSTNCVYYDNRKAVNHSNLPPAFDLEDLVAMGKEKTSCPFYAARAMNLVAEIVFCPYNYLIDPAIRQSLQINLQDNVVIVDEAHNIEDICRDAASFVFTRDAVVATIAELEHCTSYRYKNQNMLRNMDVLLAMFKLWDKWFVNQTNLINGKPLNNGEATHVWDCTDHFTKTLHNHNIGQNQYNEYQQNATTFCRAYQEDSRSFLGITQNTITLIESMNTALGYLFGNSCMYMNDFIPVFVRSAKSYDRQRPNADSLSLRLICMNPGIVFKDLKVARSVILASGTLTPLISLHSELDTEFPLKVTPNHVIPDDRIWIGILATDQNGKKLECKSADTRATDVQDAIGAAVMRVVSVTPHGVLCFLPSYMLMDLLIQRWQETGLWQQINQLKHIFQESRNIRDHNENMDDYYEQVGTDKGALLFAVYRGKVSEGMDFKDRQARAVITVGIPYPNTFDVAVKEKLRYNDKYSSARNLLSGREWLRVQAYRALNQALGRCVRHSRDWGAVLLIDARFTNPYNTEYLSKWLLKLLDKNHHTYDSLVNGENSLRAFMNNMSLKEEQEDNIM